MITICKDCEHFKELEDSMGRKDLWYNKYCLASPKDEDDLIDYSSGKITSKDDIEEYYKHCMHVNYHGDCDKYKDKKTGKINTPDEVITRSDLLDVD